MSKVFLTKIFRLGERNYYGLNIADGDLLFQSFLPPDQTHHLTHTYLILVCLERLSSGNIRSILGLLGEVGCIDEKARLMKGFTSHKNKGQTLVGIGSHLNHALYLISCVGFNESGLIVHEDS